MSTKIIEKGDLVLSPHDDLQISADSLQTLAQATRSESTASLEVFSIELPIALAPLMHTILSALKDRKAIRLSTFSTTISTREAAEILGVSRSTVIRLINDGRLTCTQARSHRRLNLSEVVNFQTEIRNSTREAVRNTTNIDDDFDFSDLVE